MNKLWWTLPGPTEYVAGTIRAIRDENHIVLALPDHVPTGLKAAIRDELSGAWPWRELSPEADGSPVNYLFERFATDASPDLIRTPQALVQQSSFANRVLWLRVRSENQWESWQPFLEEYRSACHSSPHQNPAQFVVVLEGEVATQTPREETLLTVRSWRGVVSELDATLYAAQLLRDRSLDHLPRQVAVSTVAAFALWDASVADELAANLESALKHPQGTLCDVARSRGWNAGEDPTWESGQENLFGGEELRHSAYCALRGDTNELERRRWKAQVGVVFPFLEQRRRDIIEALEDKLWAPFDRNGHSRRTETVEELEFSDILWQLRNEGTVSDDALRLIRQLRDMRNKLAHLETLEWEKLRFSFAAEIRRLLAS